MIVESCEACTKQVAVHYYEEFNITVVGDGPFCDGCWFFVRHIEALRDRVTDLEGSVMLMRKEKESTHSPYDLGAQVKQAAKNRVSTK